MEPTTTGSQMSAATDKSQSKEIEKSSLKVCSLPPSSNEPTLYAKSSIGAKVNGLLSHVAARATGRLTRNKNAKGAAINICIGTGINARKTPNAAPPSTARLPKW